MAEAQVLVARKEDILQVRVIGRATFKVSRELREYGVQTVNDGMKNIIIDLSQCNGMDSTFMGVLAMIGLEAKGKARVLVVNANEKLRNLLDSIGVSRLVEFTQKEMNEINWSSLCEAAKESGDMDEMADTIREAHKTLMNISSENVPKFKNVVDMLSSDMDDDNESNKKQE